jgi:hypothetical protein
MIQKFNLIDPDNLAQSERFLKKFDNPCIKGSEEFFLKNSKHIIIYSQKWFTWKDTGKTELFADQIEIPALAIQWIVDTIEIKFFKPPAQGGLPVDKFHHCEVIEDEELCINRSVSSGGEGIGGYRLVNLSRRSYISETDIQEFAMPDPFLFNYGLMDFLKDLGAKISRGEV